MEVNDCLKVLPGATIPVDGVVLKGSSSVNEALITGESLPIYKTSGDEVTGGTINQTGQIIMKALRVGSGTTLSRIIQMIEDAEASKVVV